MTSPLGPSAADRSLVPFIGGATKMSDDWPDWEDSFYWDEENREWVYKYADERIVAAVRRDDD